MNANSTQQDQSANSNANDHVNKRVNNNDNFLKRITQLTSQITNDPFENAFFNGTKFRDINDSLSSMLPAGIPGSTSSFP